MIVGAISVLSLITNAPSTRRRKYLFNIMPPFITEPSFIILPSRVRHIAARSFLDILWLFIDSVELVIVAVEVIIAVERLPS